MNVFLTGATGYIGSAVRKALEVRGHETVCLARSDRAARRLEAAGSRIVPGDLGNAAAWLPSVDGVDAVVHLAATFDADMAATDTAFVRALVPWLGQESRRRGRPTTLIYTGGLWLYGPVGDRAAVEGMPFDPPPAFAWMVDNRRRLVSAPDVSATFVHPAMVWDEGEGGVLAEFIDDARHGCAPRIAGSADARWPMVHREDLADLYCRVLEKGERGSDYHGVTETGVPVGRIAAAIARRFGAPAPVIESIGDAVARRGSWAACFAYDQTMRGERTRAQLGWEPSRMPVLRAFESTPGSATTG